MVASLNWFECVPTRRNYARHWACNVQWLNTESGLTNVISRGPLMQNESTAPVPLWRLMNAEKFDATRLLNVFGISSPPVNVGAIAERLGVKLESVAKDLEWAGEVDSSQGQAVIRTNRNHSKVRTRFTVAHEIGHLLLHPPGKHFRDSTSSKGVNFAEIQANNFAADLLMPSWMIKAFAPGQTVGALAKLFEVSPEAMQYRLQKLGYKL